MWMAGMDFGVGVARHTKALKRHRVARGWWVGVVLWSIDGDVRGEGGHFGGADAAYVFEVVDVAEGLLAPVGDDFGGGGGPDSGEGFEGGLACGVDVDAAGGGVLVGPLVRTWACGGGVRVGVGSGLLVELVPGGAGVGWGVVGVCGGAVGAAFPAREPGHEEGGLVGEGGGAVDVGEIASGERAAGGVEEVLNACAGIEEVEAGLFDGSENADADGFGCGRGRFGRGVQSGRTGRVGIRQGGRRCCACREGLCLRRGRTGGVARREHGGSEEDGPGEAEEHPLLAGGEETVLHARPPGTVPLLRSGFPRTTR